MKNIFGVNVTDNKHNDTADGTVFITKSADLKLMDNIDEINSETNDINKKSTIPGWASVIRFICFICASIITIGILKANVSFSEGFNNAKYLYFVGAACWIVFAILSIIKKKKFKKISESDEYSEYTERADSVLKEVYNQLGIPEDHENIDILFFRYKIKNEKIKRVSFTLYDFMNFEYMMYIENGNLCLANVYDVISIPLTSIKSITTRKTASFPNWHKEYDYNSKEYKQYKITQNSQQTYFSKYYSVLIEDPKGEFELFIPNYDIETFSQLTRVRIDE